MVGGGGGVEGKNRDKSQRSMILRKIKDKTVSLELVNIGKTNHSSD